VYEGEFDVHTNLSLVYVATSQVLLSQGRASEALEYAQKASQLRPDAGTPHYVACVSELAAGAPDIARHECDEAVRLLNRNPDFNRRLLDALHELMKKNGLGG
jgi:predicted Zn-dependent protease